jgi:hypothetical protein
MNVVAIRVPDEWKREMARAEINWSDYLRRAIRWKLDQGKRAEALARLAVRPRGGRPRRGTGAKLVREARDAG